MSDLLQLDPPVSGVEQALLVSVDAENQLYHAELSGAQADYQGLRVIPARGAADEANFFDDVVAWLEAPTVVPTPIPLEERKARLLARLAQRRWEVETGGVQVFGATFATDDRSKLLITGARSKAAADPNYVTKWKTGEGVWELVDAAVIQAAYDAVFGHVEACFAREEELAQAIFAATTRIEIESLAGDVEAFELSQ